MKYFNSKVSDQDVIDIRELYASGDYTQADLAAMYSIGNTTVFNIINGFTHKDVTNGVAIEPPKNKLKKTKAKKFHSNAHPGESHWYHKLTEKQVMEIRTIWAKNVSKKELADRYGVSSTTIVSITSNLSWKHLPSVDQIREELKA